VKWVTVLMTESRTMTERFDIRGVRPDRLDLHNSNVGEELVSAGLCGITDLRTGRACRRPAPHLGGCEFGSPASSSLQTRNAEPAEATCPRLGGEGYLPTTRGRWARPCRPRNRWTN